MTITLNKQINIKTTVVKLSNHRVVLRILDLSFVMT